MSDALSIGTHNTIIVHALWPLEPDGDSLSDAAWERLPAYISRYAQTLGVHVRAVGGSSDHVHLLLDLPTGKTLDSITAELQKAVGRFLKESLGLRDFAWDKSNILVQSVGRDERADLQRYIVDNGLHHATNTANADWEGDETEPVVEAESLPAWLRNAMPANSD